MDPKPAMTALVIDDEPSIREAAQLSLSLAGGWTVWTAETGAEGVALARRLGAALDVVLLDQMMPDMTGLETLVQLQADDLTRDIPVIFLTAKVQPRDRERFAAAGVRGVIAKPFDAMALGDTLRESLERGGDPASG